MKNTTYLTITALFLCNSVFTLQAQSDISEIFKAGVADLSNQ